MVKEEEDYKNTTLIPITKCTEPNCTQNSTDLVHEHGQTHESSYRFLCKTHYTVIRRMLNDREAKLKEATDKLNNELTIPKAAANQ